MDEKLKAIERLEKGESIKLISNEPGVGVTTVKDWDRNKTSIEDYYKIVCKLNLKLYCYLIVC